MKFREICEKVKSGEIVFDVAGHSYNHHFIERFIKRYEENLACSLGSHDGKWDCRKEVPEKINADMRDFYTRRLDFEVGDDESLSHSSEAETCSGCGQKLQWVLKGNVLMPLEFFGNSEWERHSVDYICSYAEPRPFVGKIKINSRMIFANFFSEIKDSPEDVEHTTEWSLNYMVGRENITKYKSERNVAYGQMGNMSIGIYVNENKTSVIIGPGFHPAEFDEYDSDEKFEEACKKPVFEGYELIGTIDLACWRWEGSDLNTIGEEYNELVEKGCDLVEIDAQHGEWEFKQYYRCNDQFSNDENHLYARLDLI